MFDSICLYLYHTWQPFIDRLYLPRKIIQIQFFWCNLIDEIAKNNEIDSCKIPIVIWKWIEQLHVSA